jgi:hypothetical protein
MAHTIGTTTPSCHLVVKPSFMKPRRCEGHGHCEVQMHSIWVPLKTITNATYITSPKHAHIVFQGRQRSFHNIAKSWTWATWHTWKHLPKSSKRPQVLWLKHTMGHTFIHKLKIAINGIMNANGREEQRVSMPNAAAPSAKTSVKLPIQQMTEAPPIMKAWDPTAKRNLINTKCTHWRQTHNNTPGDVLAITYVPPQIVPTDVLTPHEKQRSTHVLTQRTYPTVEFPPDPIIIPPYPAPGKKSKCTLNQPTSPQHVDNERGT